MSIIEIKDINEFYNITKGKEIMREQAKGEELVREFIRKNLPSVIARAKKSKNNQLNEEKQLREIVRHMLLPSCLYRNKYPRRCSQENDYNSS